MKIFVELFVIPFNHSEHHIPISKGMRIAQLICEKISYPNINVKDVLEETERGEQGVLNLNLKIHPLYL
jgi:dUTP pyrophosphatase